MQIKVNTSYYSNSGVTDIKDEKFQERDDVSRSLVQYLAFSIYMAA